jgi:glyoxylase-like metal-dependent hydrolase (beta-lactamase superfamily II)
MSVKQVALPADPRVRLFRSPDVDTFAIVTEQFVVLVDTQMTPENCEAILETLEPERKSRGLLVINTHFHSDHVWGNAAVPFGTPIIALEDSVSIANDSVSRSKLETRQHQDSRFSSVQLVAPNATFTDQFVLRGGDLNLHLLAAPGHCADQAVVWIPEIRTLLAADAAEYPFPYAANPKDLPILRDTLQTLRDLEPTVVLPCHGGTSDAALLTNNIAYFDELERRVRKREAWTYEDALAWMNLELEKIEPFYRDFHAQNLEAMTNAD